MTQQSELQEIETSAVAEDDLGPVSRSCSAGIGETGCCTACWAPTLLFRLGMFTLSYAKPPNACKPGKQTGRVAGRARHSSAGA